MPLIFMIRGFLKENNMFAKCYREYCNYLTRSSRSEYWIYTILISIINIVLLSVAILVFVIMYQNGTLNDNMSEEAVARAFISNSSLMIFIILLLISSVISFPWYAVAVRRLHDVGKSAWWLLISFIPIIGGIWFLVLTLLPGVKEDNQWGPNPLEVKQESINQIGICGYCFKKAFANTFNYRDRATIEEYYGFGIICCIILTLYFAIALLIGSLINSGPEFWIMFYGITFIVLGLFWLIFVFPSISLMCRRLRDAGFSPYLALLLLLACGYVGNIIAQILYILCSQPTKAEPKHEPPVYSQPPVNEGF